MCKFGSVRKIHQRLRTEGYSVSEYFIRKLIKDEKIPAVFVGSKAMISFDQVVQFLEGGQESA